MSTLTKVLIIFLFILNALYLGVTAVLFAHRVDYKKQLEETQETLEATKKEMQQKIEDRDNTIQKLQGEITSLQEKNKTLEELKKGLEKDKKDLKSEILNYQTQLTALTESFNGLKAKVEKYRQDNEALQKENKDLKESKEQLLAQYESLSQQRIQLEEELYDTKKMLALLDKEHREALKKIRLLQEVIEVSPEQIIAAGKAPKAIKGKITAVDYETGIVILNIGKKDGIYKGMEFYVFRGGNFITQIKIRNVIDESNSSAMIIKETLQEPVEVGDEVNNSSF